MKPKDFCIQTPNQFESLAKKLLVNTSLLINEQEVEFRDIEFYLNNQKDHKDQSTHKHDYKAGFLRPHGSGMDITIGVERKSWGGILIRGVKIGSEYYTGPLVCKEQIFRYGNSLVDGLGNVKLGKRGSLVRKDQKVLSCPRVNLGKNAGAHSDLEYRYILFDREYLKKPGVFKGGKEDQFVKWVEDGTLSIEQALMGFNYRPKKILAVKKKN